MLHKFGKSAILVVSEIDYEAKEPPTERQDEPRSRQGEATKKGKLKYVPGPIESLIDQAGLMGLQLVVNSKKAKVTRTTSITA